MVMSTLLRSLVYLEKEVSCSCIAFITIVINFGLFRLLNLSSALGPIATEISRLRCLLINEAMTDTTKELAFNGETLHQNLAHRQGALLGCFLPYGVH